MQPSSTPYVSPSSVLWLGLLGGHYRIPASWREMASWFCDFLSVGPNWMLFISWKEAPAKGQLSTRRFSIFKTHGDEAHPFPHPLMIKCWKEKALPVISQWNVFSEWGIQSHQKHETTNGHTLITEITRYVHKNDLELIAKEACMKNLLAPFSVAPWYRKQSQTHIWFTKRAHRGLSVTRGQKKKNKHKHACQVELQMWVFL